jgi:hypothetical protein
MTKRISVDKRQIRMRGGGRGRHAMCPNMGLLPLVKVVLSHGILFYDNIFVAGMSLINGIQIK